MTTSATEQDQQTITRLISILAQKDVELTQARARIEAAEKALNTLIQEGSEYFYKTRGIGDTYQAEVRFKEAILMANLLNPATPTPEPREGGKE